MINSNYNDYFGRSKSVFNKSYIDYLLLEIKKVNELTETENRLLEKAKFKYRLHIGLNFFIFILTCNKIKKSCLKQILGNDLVLLHERFWFINIVSITIMYFIYRESQRNYYNDVKYLIKKYKGLKYEQYSQAKINNTIAEVYKNELKEIENSKNEDSLN
jgi:hypothetical protein